MKKDKKNLIVLVIALVLVVFSSYLLFASGITGKLSASANKMTASLDDNPNASYYPVITMLINSSGERLVNENVAITVEAEGNYKVDKVYYSYDKKTWNEGNAVKIDAKKSVFKIIFSQSMNEKVYIVVENEKGYRSYPYETIVNIDKEKPSVGVSNYFEKVIINASDDLELSKVQYSNDKINWEEIVVDGKDISIQGENYSYVRVVDTAGNISNIKKIGN